MSQDHPVPSADKTSTELSRARNRQVAKIEMGYGVSFTINESNLPLLIGRDPDSVRVDR